MDRRTDAFDLNALEEMEWKALRLFWRARFRSEPPSGRATELLRREIAWRLQASHQGDLDVATKRALRKAASRARQAGSENSAPDLVLPLGATLVRDWRGKSHVVKATNEGFLHNGSCYSSLSAVARTITGARWSGPRFFGVGK